MSDRNDVDGMGRETRSGNGMWFAMLLSELTEIFEMSSVGSDVAVNFQYIKSLSVLLPL